MKVFGVKDFRLLWFWDVRGYWVWSGVLEFSRFATKCRVLSGENVGCVLVFGAAEFIYKHTYKEQITQKLLL